MEDNSKQSKGGDGSNDAAIKDQVLTVLREQKIKLWVPPYVNDHGETVEKALEDLVNQNAGLLPGSSQGLVLQSLKDLQSHALAKLQAKKLSTTTASPKSVRTTLLSSTPVNLEAKILGLPKHFEVDLSSIDCSIAKNVSLFTEKAPVLRLDGVSLQHTTDVQLLDFLRAVFHTNNVRVIHRGKTLTGPTNGHEMGPTSLGCLLQSAAVVVPLLCMVSPKSQNNAGDKGQEPANTLYSRIAAIRQAARQIRDSTNLEITDQHGVTVPMSADDRLGFLTALALHRMGVQTDLTTREDALVLLLEADKEWKDHPRLQPWKDRVDNYGLLQLDIAWVYLQLESLDNLPDSIQRLEEAERVLRKQVHVNFVTLALAQAEMGNYKEVPPLSAVFAKLFVLQGIAYLCDSRLNPGSAAKGQERLNQAFVLLQSLRMLAPDDAVQQLLEISQRDSIAPSDAIAALRQSQGNLDVAAMALAEAETTRQQRQRDREVQHNHGVCQNETDPVDLALVEKLRPLLGSSGSTDLAVGLLRLSNNDLSRALDLYAECELSPDAVSTRVETLDERLVQRGLLNRTVWRNKKRKLSRMKEKPVDEMALVTLLSMGVDDRQARLALQSNANNVEQALLWLSTTTDVTTEAAAPAATGVAEESTAPTGSVQGKTEGEDEEMAPSEEVGSGQEERTQDDDEDDSAESDVHFEDTVEWAAKELLHQELGDILEERNLEKEVLGLSLDEEWRLVLKYRGDAN
ncbi:Negative regulator of ubiquitin-like proteins 1 [Seminavis robusta]|uniref:Negative regulator of ubiquitin-like proteins 1 n=1 Tax=Seminavis robusta TaxID=568900 RepID=A0A9N8HKT4_9STRA|nr:Negative regulator of ubiquitin-like proteins 1 [Seminavis robusta]|eukprot:Sro970_g226310.1 Negative regulator of ubiquitin-like proteins 1 (742) ;mRNA; r:10920-13244